MCSMVMMPREESRLAQIQPARTRLGEYSAAAQAMLGRLNQWLQRPDLSPQDRERVADLAGDLSRALGRPRERRLSNLLQEGSALERELASRYQSAGPQRQWRLPGRDAEARRDFPRRDAEARREWREPRRDAEARRDFPRRDAEARREWPAQQGRRARAPTPAEVQAAEQALGELQRGLEGRRDAPRGTRREAMGAERRLRRELRNPQDAARLLSLSQQARDAAARLSARREFPR